MRICKFFCDLGPVYRRTCVPYLCVKNELFREYLLVIYMDSEPFRFFINPQTNKFSDEFIHFAVPENHLIRSVLEMMAAEYSNKQSDT